MKFYDEIVTYYDDIFPLAEAKVGFVKALIEDRGAHSLLDVGCATGTFCSEVVQHLDSVDGFDLDELMIHRARELYSDDQLNYAVGNMLTMSKVFPDKSYDMVTCFGNTLVHLSQEGMLQTFRGIKNKLIPGGVFLGQILNYDHVIDNEVKVLPPIDNNQISFDRSYTWQSEEALMFTALLTVKATKETYENAIELYPLRKEQLKVLLLESGFTQVEFFKNYKGEATGGKHLPLIFVAE